MARALALALFVSLPTACEGGNTASGPTIDPVPTAPPTEPRAPIPPVALANGAFDDGKPGLSGWETEIGATNATGGIKSTAAITLGSGRSSSAALELSGAAATAQWLMVGQSFPASAGNQVVASFYTRTNELVREGEQYVNANAVLLYFDAAGKRLSIEGTTPVTGTTDWRKHTLVSALAPKGTTRAKLAFMSSMTGTMWVDDVSVMVRALAPWSASTAPEAWGHWVSQISATYPFSPVESGRVEWAAATALLRPKAIAATDRAVFVEVLVGALRPLHDPHVAVVVDGLSKPTLDWREIPRTWNLAVIKEAIQDSILAENEFTVARLKSGLGYVHIGSWAKGREPIDRVLKAMDQLQDVRGWVIDVRMNQGGNDQWATLLASRFAAQSTVFAKHRFRSEDGYGPWNERTLNPSGLGAPDSRKVVVLQSPWCMSSNEGFILMMRALPTVTTVGLPSRGATRNPGTIHVTSDISVNSSRWEAALLDGTLIEGVGIPPDVRVDAPISAYVDADPTLAKAIALLR